MFCPLQEHSLDLISSNKFNFKDYKNCVFSHNLNEIFFHPFIYKTIFCPFTKEKNVKECSEDCFYSHDYYNDFRFLARYDKLDVMEIILFCVNKRLFGFNKKNSTEENFNNILKIFRAKNVDLYSIKEIINSIILDNKKITYEHLPSEFNPFTYKVFECPLGDKCKLDTFLCLNYHNLKERRRNPIKFKYGGKKCKNIFDRETNHWKNPNKCDEVNLYFKFFS